MEPTKRPIYTASGEKIYGETPEDGMVAKVYGDPELADLMARSVNAHDKLVAACRAVGKFFLLPPADQEFGTHFRVELQREINAALAEAEAATPETR